MSKICTKCGDEKDIGLFAKSINEKDGYKSLCKDCYNKKMREYNKSHKESKKQRDKEYYEKNKSKVLAQIISPFGQ